MDQRLESVVASVLGLDTEEICDQTSSETCPAWDSLRHFHLILALEQAFGVRFSSQAIPDLVSVGRIREELARLGVK
jgi:acyl carrier protein